MECGELKARFIDGRKLRASTEPHSLECGEFADGKGDAATVEASTEPHSLECGETTNKIDLTADGGLQRSRTRWSAER